MCLFLRENNSNSSSLLEIFSRWHLYCKCCFVLFHSQVKSCTFQHKSRNITHSAYICHIGTYINYIYIDQLLLAFSSTNNMQRVFLKFSQGKKEMSIIAIFYTEILMRKVDLRPFFTSENRSKSTFSSQKFSVV